MGLLSNINRELVTLNIITHLPLTVQSFKHSSNLQQPTLAKMSKALLVILLLAVVATVCFAQERYPAGVHPSTCPNYPFCNTAGLGAPAGYIFDRFNHQYPPGVHPAACPNYPYC